MKHHVQRSLACLHGQELCLTRRALEIRQFHFGEIQGHGDKWWGKFALHVSGPWRLDGPEGLVTGSEDLGHSAAGTAGADSDGADVALTLQDVSLGRFFGVSPGKAGFMRLAGKGFVVEKVDVDAGAALTIRLSFQVAIRAFPAGTLDEAWRFFSPDADERHLVIVGDRLDET